MTPRYMLIAAVLTICALLTIGPDELQEDVYNQKVAEREELLNPPDFVLNPPETRLGESHVVPGGTVLTVWTNQKQILFGGIRFDTPTPGNYRFFVPDDKKQTPRLL